MQVKIKLGRQWWLLPTAQEFTEDELKPFMRVARIGVLQTGESVHFFDMQEKARVLEILEIVKKAAQHRMKPTLSPGMGIAFVPAQKSKVAVPA